MSAGHSRNILQRVNDKNLPDDPPPSQRRLRWAGKRINLPGEMLFDVFQKRYADFDAEK